MLGKKRLTVNRLNPIYSGKRGRHFAIKMRGGSREMRTITMALIASLGLAGTGQAGWVPQASGVGFWLRGVSFADSLVGIAVGDSQALLRTVDGGANWQIVASGVYGNDADMVTSQIGWFVGGSVWKTTNGGLNWTPQGTGGQAVSFSDIQHGLVVGLGGNVYRTTNGGSTWVTETTNVKRDLFDVCMVDSLHAWACGYDGGRDTFPIVVSRDGGQTWSKQPMPQNGPTMLTGISFSDTLHGIAVGWDRPILRTENGGSTWDVVFTPDGKSKTDVVLVDSLRAWLVGTPWVDSSALIDGTTDGGRTWTVQNPVTNQCLYSVSFVDRRQGWAVGMGGTIVHTNDGGAGVEDERGQGDKRKRIREEILKVSPNPFTSSAKVSGHERERFILFDITGREVGHYSGDRIGVGLAAGVYFIQPEKGSGKPLRIVKIR